MHVSGAVAEDRGRASGADRRMPDGRNGAPHLDGRNSGLNDGKQWEINGKLVGFQKPHRTQQQHIVIFSRWKIETGYHGNNTYSDFNGKI